MKLPDRVVVLSGAACEVWDAVVAVGGVGTLQPATDGLVLQLVASYATTNAR
ncbi:hypothetical protein [Streptomyces niveus]|uniref:hypothetical protein n=1 Tax=Streptomyces niveus TaxID=193462 RepID=UPI00362D37E1